MPWKPSSVRFGLALLIGATLAIGALAFSLLRREERRLAAEAQQALQARAQSLADDVQLAVQGVEDELLNRLAAIRGQELRVRLAEWEKDNPLIRNVFAWRRSTRRLEYPDPAAPATAEEKSFVQRYGHLFAERLEPLLRTGAAERAPPAPSSPRMDLQRAAQALRAEPAAPVGRRGWIPWFEGDQLFLLGWVEQGDIVCGAEVETMTLLSRLTQAFPREHGLERAWTLLDGAGNIVYQNGGLEVRDTRRPVVAASLNPVLPHWQIALFTAGGRAAGLARGSYRLVSSLLVLALLTAILAGGTLLLREAGRQTREARQKTSFVANVSHELKTPLTTLRMYAELLREGRVREPEKRQHYLDVMVTECGRLTRLVNNMLDFGRLEQNRRAYAVEPLELTAWLPAFLDPHRLRIEEAGLQVQLRLPDAPCPINTDRDALEQALLNLLDNALKYAAAGGAVDIELTAAHAGMRLDVLDRGPGVPTELREQIFEKFYRLDQSLTARVPGSGLGLSIARRLLRDLGGDLVCLPREGGGACFRITLPASPTPATERT